MEEIRLCKDGGMKLHTSKLVHSKSSVFAKHGESNVSQFPEVPWAKLASYVHQ